MTFKRRRRTTSLATTTTTTTTAAVVVAAATLMNIATGETTIDPHQERREGDHAQFQRQQHHDATDASHPHHPEFHRRLAQSAAEAFATWTNNPEKILKAEPLDLKIDVSDGTGYRQGSNGYLERYEDSFGHNSSVYWDSIVSVESIVNHGEDVHVQSDRETPKMDEEEMEEEIKEEVELFYKMLEEDGIDMRTATTKTTATRRKKGLRGPNGGRKGSRQGHGRALEAKTTVDAHLDSLGFDSASEWEDAQYDSHEEEQEEEDEDEDEEPSIISSLGRSLQSNNPFETTRGNRRRNNNNRNRNKKKNKQTNHKRKLPRIDRLTPTNGDTIQGKQTFSARAQPSSVTKEEIKTVSFQLKDMNGASSGWLDVPKVSSSMYEITVDGFDRYVDTDWSYVMQVEDANGKKSSTDAIGFTIGGSSNGGNDKNDKNDNDKEVPSKAPPAPSPRLPKKKVTDSDWTHEGAIQAATGRIMFEFDDGTDQSFVCSGTVVMDGRGGGSVDADNGRTIIQTAAHCAYNDVLKKFANKAVFIPDQVSTRGDKSNFVSSDDPYGIWYLSFATIAKGWRDGSFPNNVPYDYAYYTVFNNESTHEGGYLRGLTGILEKDVTPMKIDFDTDPFDEFVFSIGYSADKDPSLRHCSMENESINGVPWYKNLWLKDCAMTGGASGGPWMRDLDEGGVGTLISVNSWGFTHKPGMAGPVLRTRDGSWAECLFDTARSANDPGKVGGIVVERCSTA